jgi:hypothetical protein
MFAIARRAPAWRTGACYAVSLDTFVLLLAFFAGYRITRAAGFREACVECLLRITAIHAPMRCGR